jgi:hypothetical protein
MAITSHDFWLHNLSPKVWKTLHMFVYLAYFLFVMHVMLGVIQYETHPVFVILISLGAVWLITLHLIAGTKEVKKDKEKFIAASDGFVYVSEATNLKKAVQKYFALIKNGSLFTNMRTSSMLFIMYASTRVAH